VLPTDAVRVLPTSVLVGYKQVTPIWRLTFVNKYVDATSLCYLELRRKVFQSTQAWSALALDEDAVTRTYELVNAFILTAAFSGRHNRPGIPHNLRQRAIHLSERRHLCRPSLAQTTLRILAHKEELIEVRSQERRKVSDRIKVATRHSSRLSEYCMDQNEDIRRCFEELIGKPVGESFHLIPPFYTDYGLNITVGRAVFLGYQCAFTGHAANTIANEVMIAHKVNLVTPGHPVEPHIGRHYITVRQSWSRRMHGSVLPQR
jgi:acetyltransferase-like isoleucine patch superfamily enzyme